MTSVVFTYWRLKLFIVKKKLKKPKPIFRFISHSSLSLSQSHSFISHSRATVPSLSVRRHRSTPPFAATVLRHRSPPLFSAIVLRYRSPPSQFISLWKSSLSLGTIVLRHLRFIRSLHTEESEEVMESEVDSI
ncbi:uncharacterized protein LOC130715366 [Lotus japonicus]|uniref:uncharacterized protein LOC130715366 n=1 Tax=Lotus japonicus TaxID=34305 RepID=UPI002584120F|nr:uncharacterized protein LOC130715366 [Lotus japonicus]